MKIDGAKLSAIYQLFLINIHTYVGSTKRCDLALLLISQLVIRDYSLIALIRSPQGAT